MRDASPTDLPDSRPRQYITIYNSPEVPSDIAEHPEARQTSSRWIYAGALGSVLMTLAQFLTPGTNNVNQTLGVENIDGLLYIGSGRAADLSREVVTPDEHTRLQQRVRRWRAGTLTLITMGGTYTGAHSVIDAVRSNNESATPTSIGLAMSSVVINMLVSSKLHPDAAAGTGHGDAWRHAVTDAAVGIGMSAALFVSWKAGDSAEWARLLPDIAATAGSAAVIGANFPTRDRVDGLTHHLVAHTHHHADDMT